MEGGGGHKIDYFCRRRKSINPKHTFFDYSGGIDINLFASIRLILDLKFGDNP